ncbi:stage III sporulation protein AG [Intestinibacter sp.]|uniref:stage III sporulation protein AG n=1 Tax=Intestinibacter sp. TaxID=1965304 RepID=UPI003F16DFBA
MFKKLDLNEKEKKKLITLLSLGLVCLISLVLINFIQNRNNKNQENANSEIQASEQLQKEETKSEEEDLESRLTDILKEINGSGDVSVMITYDNSEEIEPAYNSNSTKETTSETDSSGGERTVETSSENKTMVTSDSSKPIVIKTKEAKIKGVIVVASGASNPQVKETLYEAVQTALQISGHQVQVYAK